MFFVLGKSNLSYMVTNKDTLYTKIVAFDRIYKFIVLIFII
jgi:hypothetical protein